jgi:hypothetical protein
MPGSFVRDFREIEGANSKFYRRVTNGITIPYVFPGGFGIFRCVKRADRKKEFRASGPAATEAMAGRKNELFFAKATQGGQP